MKLKDKLIRSLKLEFADVPDTWCAIDLFGKLCCDLC